MNVLWFGKMFRSQAKLATFFNETFSTRKPAETIQVAQKIKLQELSEITYFFHKFFSFQFSNLFLNGTLDFHTTPMKPTHKALF